VVIFGSNAPKHKVLADAFRKHGAGTVVLAPLAAQLGADACVDMVDAAGYSPLYFIALIDFAVPVADLLNQRLRRPANNPETWMLRRDKFEQQEALCCNGFRGAAKQLVTSDVEVALKFASEFEVVIIKPRDSSGGDGNWICRSAAEVREIFAAELGRVNEERRRNSELVVMECFSGDDWVVNSISLDGNHKISDIWRGPAKMRCSDGGAEQFIYDRQFLASMCPEVFEVAQFTFQVLDILGVSNGAAHTEIIWSGQPCDHPRLCEVNPRCAGGMPRTPYSPTQLELLVISLHEPDHFRSLPNIPEVGDVRSAVVFLRAPRDCWLPAASLDAFAGLLTFARFDRGMQRQKAPFKAQRVKRTTGLCSSPGVVVLHGTLEDIEEDADRIRAIEAFAYCDVPEPSDEFLHMLRLQSPRQSIDLYLASSTSIDDGWAHAHES
jgi:hypothetical protein